MWQDNTTSLPSWLLCLQDWTETREPIKRAGHNICFLCSVTYSYPDWHITVYEGHCLESTQGVSRTDASNGICHGHLPPTGTAGFSISPELFSASGPFIGAHSAATDRERLEQLNIVSATSPEIVSEKQLSSPEKNTGLKTHADPTLWVIMLPFNIIQIQIVYGITFL